MYNKNAKSTENKKPAWIIATLMILSVLGAVYPNLRPYIDKVKPVIEKIEIPSPAPDDKTLMLSEGEESTLTIPSSADEYTIVHLKTNAAGQYFDLMVLTVRGSEVMFVDTVKTANNGEWVFTGPPGKYSIRLSVCDPTAGCKSMTGNVTIGKVPVPQPTPQPTPTPTPTPTPQPTPTPTPSPTPTPPIGPVTIPEDTYGMTKWAYDALNAIPIGDRMPAVELANNFESVASAIAAGGIKTPQEGNLKLSEKNRATLNVPAGIQPSHPYYKFFVSFADRLTDLNRSGKLPNSANAYKDVYLESCAGMRLVMGIK